MNIQLLFFPIFIIKKFGQNYFVKNEFKDGNWYNSILT
jgi:hypothetical protein